MDRGSGPSLEVHEVTSPMRPEEEKMISIGSKNQSAGPSEEGKGLNKGKLKKTARERGKAQDVDMSIQAHEVGKKRAGIKIRKDSMEEKATKGIKVMMERRCLPCSTAESNEPFSLELPRAREPSDSSSFARIRAKMGS